MANFETYKKKILGFYRRHRRMPSYSEIMELVGLRSKHTVYKLVNKLVDLGVVAKDASGKLTPKNIGETVRVLGYVEAGWPSPAEEVLLDTMTLDNYLIQNREATYIVKVSGRSMVGAGILPGDLVLVERGRDVKEGDIVIAEVDGAWTMKYYRTKNGKPILYPANPAFKPIVPKQELSIAAVVMTVLRKYH
jgi:SOS regulatory protein LexA